MTLVSPSRTISIGDKKYTLDGSFGTLRTIQQFFDKDIVAVLMGIPDMTFDKICDLMALGSGRTADSIGETILENMGVMSREYTVLKAEILAWLNIAVTPKADREKKSAEWQVKIGKLSSPGEITSALPSASLDGSPANSGAVTSGS